MKNSLNERLTALERLSQTIAVPPAALVQVIGPDGRTAAQISAAVVALRNGVRIHDRIQKREPIGIVLSRC